MRYVLFVNTPEASEENLPENEMQALMERYGVFAGEAGAAGALETGERLQSTTTATTIRVRNGKRLLTDGPFAETKEQIGGFFIIKADNLDEAIEWAAKIPGVETGSIEIRPIWE